MGFRDAVTAALADPNLRPLLVKLARGLVDGAARSRDLHWDRESDDEAQLVEVVDPRDVDPRALSYLGALSRVSYVATKGRRGEQTEYEHTFSNPFPLLYADADELVIVRGRSRYRVKRHGIVG